MRKPKVLDFMIYRWRYSLGYIGVSLLLLALLVVAGVFIPDGLTKQEMASTAASGTFSLQNFTPEMIVNAPYHILQKISFIVFGVSNLSIKLPSLIFAFLSAIGMLLLLRSWFKQNVAVLTTLLMFTTGQFLLIAQTGTPYILYIFWSVWLLLSASMVSKNGPHQLPWRVLLFVFIALSLYTPLSIYILLALLSATILHPHLRHTVNSLPNKKLLIAAATGLLVVSPIIYAVFVQPTIALQLLGIPSQMPPLSENAWLLLKQYFDFLHPSNGIVMTPLYSLTTMLLVGIGLYRTFTTKYTATSYIIIAWLVLLLPVMVLSPMTTSITFVPFLILMALGIDYLFRYWYRLFPTNPYARAAGLVPLAILIASMTFSGLERFTYGYSYGEGVATHYSKDLSLLRTETASVTSKTTLLVAPEQAAFYKVFERYYDAPNLTVTTKKPEATSNLIVTRAAKLGDVPQAPSKIITNSYEHEADRFYLYKKSAI